MCFTEVTCHRHAMQRCALFDDTRTHFIVRCKVDFNRVQLHRLPLYQQRAPDSYAGLFTIITVAERGRLCFYLCPFVCLSVCLSL